MTYHLQFKIQHLLFLPFLLVLSFSGLAQKQVPELWGQRVHDEAHILKSETIDQLEKELKIYEDSTSNQIAILIVQSLDKELLEEYSIRVAEKWKLGTKEKDNGVLLLVAVDDHKTRIEVGHGLEGVLTDAQSNRIIRNELAPNFRRGDYDAGIISAINAIIKSIGGEYKEDDLTVSSDDDIGIVGKIIGSGFLILIGIMIISFLVASLFNTGCASWLFYTILIVIGSLFPFNIIGPTGTGILLIILIITKILINRSKFGKRMAVAWSLKGGSGGSGGGGWSSSSGWGGGSGGGGFSGGGGSFGGGGSSGSW